MNDEPPKQSKGSSSRLKTLLANERTFLAWVRTGIALMAFGFIVEKAGSLLEALIDEIPQRQQTYVHYSGLAGVVLMTAGALIIMLSTFRFWRLDRRIKNDEYTTSMALDILVALIITVISVIYILFLIYQSTTV